ADDLDRQELSELTHGDIRVESRIAIGTAFTFTFPIRSSIFGYLCCIETSNYLRLVGTRQPSRPPVVCPVCCQIFWIGKELNQHHAREEPANVGPKAPPPPSPTDPPQPEKDFFREPIAEHRPSR